MTRYEYGFLTKCAEYGIDPAWLVKESQSSGIDLQGVLDSIKNRVSDTYSAVKSDPVNKGVIPGLIGAALGSMASGAADTLTMERDEYKRKRNRLVLALLGSAAFMDYNAHNKHMSGSLPKVKDGKLTIGV